VVVESEQISVLQSEQDRDRNRLGTALGQERNAGRCVQIKSKEILICLQVILQFCGQ